jgi:hypothetical protein
MGDFEGLKNFTGGNDYIVGEIVRELDLEVEPGNRSRTELLQSHDKN